MARQNKNLQDFEFIYSEIIRFIDLLKNDRKSIDYKSDGLYFLQSPDGAGHFLIGYAAKKRFSAIAGRILNANPSIKDRASKKLVVSTAEHIFYEEIIKRGRSLTASLSDKMVSRVVKHIEKNKLRTITQFFPCIFPTDKDSGRFNIGPVRFTKTSILLEEREAQFKEYIKKSQKNYIERAKLSGKTLDQEQKEKNRKFVKIFPRELRDYYSNYPWIASIEMANFDETRSREVASICVQAALNVIRLYFPSDRIKIYMASGSAFESKPAAMVEENGSIDIVLSRPGLLRESAGWIATLEQKENYWLKLAGALIPFLSSAAPVPLLYQRYINALWWYGEAMVSKPPYLRIISLSNALEAFLCTSSRGKDIVKQISARANAFLQYGETDIDWVKETKEFYDLRSDLVHGRIPAFDKKVQQKIERGIEIVQRVLIDGLIWTKYLDSQEGCRDSLPRIHEEFESNLVRLYSGELFGIKVVAQ
ncbi:MAG: hypothetical protein IPM20_06445 [Gammaproteobacteria bacterium]|nr:hypothetical protein [Gammaproteobacteria bacterium]